MKKIFQVLAGIFIIAGLLFLLIYSSVVTASPNESFARDIFDLPIPNPPLWTSYIPVLGGFLMFIFQFFSIHGLVGIGITGALLYIGGIFLTIGGKEEQVKKNSKLISSNTDLINEDSNKLFFDDPDVSDDEEITDEVITVSGTDIDELMNPNVYEWAHKDLQSLEDQVNRFLVDYQQDAEKTINFIEYKLLYRPDKCDEIYKLISNSTLPSIIKQELIYQVLKRKEKPIKVFNEEINPDNMPKLYLWAKTNPKILEGQLKSVADKWHEGNISSAMQALESDLEHG